MSQRRTGFMRIDFHYDAIENDVDAKNIMKKLKDTIEYTAKSNKNKDYTCQFLIAYSSTNIRTHRLVKEKTGRRGRPRILEIPLKRNGTYKKTSPHFHILIYANPCETFTKLIVEKINKLYNLHPTRKPIEKRRCDLGYISYVLEQKKYAWKGGYDPNNKLKGFDFTEAKNISKELRRLRKGFKPDEKNRFEPKCNMHNKLIERNKYYNKQMNMNLNYEYEINEDGKTEIYLQKTINTVEYSVQNSRLITQTKMQQTMTTDKDRILKEFLFDDIDN